MHGIILFKHLNILCGITDIKIKKYHQMMLVFKRLLIKKIFILTNY